MDSYVNHSKSASARSFLCTTPGNKEVVSGHNAVRDVFILQRRQQTCCDKTVTSGLKITGAENEKLTEVLSMMGIQWRLKRMKT